MELLQHFLQRRPGEWFSQFHFGNLPASILDGTQDIRI